MMRFRPFVPLFLFLLFICLPAAAQATRQDMIVNTEWLAERLDGQVLVIEVGEKTDYDRGHIPFARLLERRALLVSVDRVPNEVPPIADLERTFTQLGVGERSRIVLYSRDPLLATRAWFTLDYVGHGHRTSVLNGGYARWVAEGRATTTEAPMFEATAFSATPNPVALTTLKAMKVLVQNRGSLGSALVMIDARPAQGYRGQLAGAGVDRAGHIPGAVNVPWPRNLDGDREGALFRSDAELRTLYGDLGLTRGTTVITYCRTGVEASMTYFVLRYLGFDVALYDGSFIEWSRQDSTPVV